MIAEAIAWAAPATAWMLTYLLHSTLLLGAAWLVSRRLAGRSLALEETLWRTALVGALITASLQAGLGWRPVTGAWTLAAVPAVEVDPTAGSATRSTAAATVGRRTWRAEPSSGAGGPRAAADPTPPAGTGTAILRAEAHRAAADPPAP
ncbi:MAG TPA: hypothetical protein VHQ65_00595, partial [Thermoanaerobaculia bacterium]|nr:hypothetical protein [Thermoanaerobaculia bacterium]